MVDCLCGMPSLNKSHEWQGLKGTGAIHYSTEICPNILKYASSVTSRAGTKFPTPPFLNASLQLSTLNRIILAIWWCTPQSTVSSLNISLQNMKALWVKLKIWCTNFVHLIFPWICDAFFVWEHSLLCQYLCTFLLEIESNAYLIQDVKSSQTYKIGRISCNHGQTTVRGLEHIHDLSLRLKFVKSMKILGDRYAHIHYSLKALCHVQEDAGH